MLQDIQCERLTISGLLTSRQAVDYARETLQPECFTDPMCSKMFNAISEIDKEGKSVDIMTVFDYLQRHQKEGEPTMTPMDVTSFGDKYVPDITEYAARLVDFAHRRAINTVASRLINLTSDLTADVGEVLTQSRDILDNEINRTARKTMNVKESVKSVKQRIKENASTTKPRGTLTGFSWIDKRGGFQNGDFIVIAGASSMGKTSCALSIALNMLLHGEPIAYYSMEMQHYQLTARLLSMRTGVISSNILYKHLSDEEMGRVNAAAPELEQKNCLYYDDESTTSIDAIIASIRSLHLKYKIHGAFIDYLQIVKLSQNNGRDESALAEAARRLKNTAKELDIWICALSQLNRKNDGMNDDPMPTMDRLRGSGQIAEAADTVILLYRPEYYEKTKFPKPFQDEDVHGKAMIIIGKGRNIGTGKFICTFVPELTYYTELPPDRLPSIIYNTDNNNGNKNDNGNNSNQDPFEAARQNEYGDELPF